MKTYRLEKVPFYLLLVLLIVAIAMMTSMPAQAITTAYTPQVATRAQSVVPEVTTNNTIVRTGIIWYEPFSAITWGKKPTQEKSGGFMAETVWLGTNPACQAMPTQQFETGNVSGLRPVANAWCQASKVELSGTGPVALSWWQAPKVEQCQENALADYILIRKPVAKDVFGADEALFRTDMLKSALAFLGSVQFRTVA